MFQFSHLVSYIFRTITRRKLACISFRDARSSCVTSEDTPTKGISATSGKLQASSVSVECQSSRVLREKKLSEI